MNPKIISEQPITLATLKKELNSIKKRDEELNFRSGKTEEYLNTFSKSMKASSELEQRLIDLNIPRIRDEMIVKITDLMPKTVEDLKNIIQAYPTSVTEDNLKKIVKAVNE